MKSPQQINKRWLKVAFVYLLVLLVLSQLPIIIKEPLDKVIHIVAYGALVGLFLKAFPPDQASGRWIGIICGTAIVAVLIEIAQIFFDRHFCLHDMAASFIGILCGSCIMYFGIKKIRRDPH